MADDLERTPPGAEAFAQWTRTLLRLARSEQELGRRVEAQAVLERLLRAAPDVRADARQYPPSFVALVEETRARLRSLEHHRLTVESQPEAQVFVEGREVGTTPVTIELPAGRYRVAGVRGGVRAPVVVADVSSEDRVVQLDMSVAEVLRPEAGPGLALGATDRPLRIITASARLGLDRAITTELLLEGDATLLVATLHEVRRGTAEREGRLRLTGGAPLAGGMDALAEFLLTGAPSPLVSTATGPSLALLPSALEQRQGLPPLKEQLRAEPSRAHGWVAFGSGIASVVAGGATIAFAVTASSRYDDARAMLDGGQVLPPRTNRDYNAVVRDGDSYRTAAIVSGVTAGLALATTAVLSYVSYQQTGEVGPFRF